MYELKKNLEWYLRVNLLGPGPRLLKKNYRVAIPQRFRKNDLNCQRAFKKPLVIVHYINVFQPSARGPVPGPGIIYTGPREVLLEIVILVF